MTSSSSVSLVEKTKILEDVKLGVSTWNVGNANPLDSFEAIWPNRGAGFDICVQGMQESTYTDEEPNDEFEDRDGDEKAKAVDVITRTKSAKTSTETASTSDAGTDRASQNMRRSKKRASSVPDLGFRSYADLEERLMRAFNGDAAEGEGEWEVAIHSYRAQMQIYVMVRKSLAGAISNVEERVENTGFLHVFPNKGGILVSFDLYGTSLSFITCHLTAHEGVAFCAMRNDSIKEILGGVRVGDERFDVSNQKHHVFWMGDMNYRTCFDTETPPRSKRDEDLSKEEEERRIKMLESASMTNNEDGEGGKAKKEGKKDKVAKQVAIVTGEIKDNNWGAIIARDELNREIAGNRALAGFTALQPSFPPTFKRKRQIGMASVGADKWEFQEELDALQFYDQKRTPSYTDRILFRSMPSFAKFCVSESFISFEECITSDHKPVRATFNLTPTPGAAGILVNARAMDLSPHDLIAEGEGFEVIVTKMTGRHLAEMDWGGGSDPYMVATTDPANLLSVRNANHMIKTKYLVNNINPDWGRETLRIPIVSCDVEGLAQNAHLYLSVWDYDLTNEDDLIGLARIPFFDIFEAAKKGQALHYNEDVYENGEVCGSIQGQIEISVPYAELRERLQKEGAVPLNEASFIEIDDCCCSLS